MQRGYVNTRRGPARKGSVWAIPKARRREVGVEVLSELVVCWNLVPLPTFLAQVQEPLSATSGGIFADAHADDGRDPSEV